jgi:hypothetical protein
MKYSRGGRACHSVRYFNRGVVQAVMIYWLEMADRLNSYSSNALAALDADVSCASSNTRSEGRILRDAKKEQQELSMTSKIKVIVTVCSHDNSQAAARRREARPITGRVPHVACDAHTSR